MGKNTALIILCFLFTKFISLGQSSKTDSLLGLLQNEMVDTTRIDILNELGNELILKSQKESQDYYIEARQKSIDVNDTIRIVTSLIGLCDVYSMNGEYKRALEYITEAMNYAYNNYDLLATCHSRLAIEYYNLGKDEESIKHDRLALHYDMLLKDSFKIAYDLHNIGTYFLGTEHNDSATCYYKKSNEYIKNIDDELTAYNNSRIGFAHSHAKEYDTAINYHLLALERFERDSSLYEMAMEETYLANLQSLKNNYTKTREHIDNAKKYSYDLNNHALIKTVHHLYYELYNNQKNYEKALEHTLLKQAYGDSIEKKNQENIIERLRTEQSYGEQQRTLESTEKSNKELASKQQKLLILSISTIILLIICIVVLIENRLKQIKNKELLVQVNQINDYQKKLLSIIGHDLRDSVGNMKNFTELMHYNLLENKSINQMVTKFVPMVNSTYDLLNNLLFWSKNNSNHFTPQYESVSNLKLITETIKHVDHLAKAKEIEIVEMVDEAFLECDKNMMLTILRNLLTNAIKFSYPNSKIHIGSNAVENMILFSICDHGVGMTNEQITKVLSEDINERSKGTAGEHGSGLGLSLCFSFVKKHNGQISAVSSPGKGSTFYLHLPLSKHQKIDSKNVERPVACWIKKHILK